MIEFNRPDDLGDIAGLEDATRTFSPPNFAAVPHDTDSPKG
jgi:hypothetical protein